MKTFYSNSLLIQNTIPIRIVKNTHVFRFHFIFFSFDSLPFLSSTIPKLNQCDILWHTSVEPSRRKKKKTDTKIWLIEIIFFSFVGTKAKKIVNIHLCIWSVEFGENQSKTGRREKYS